jgi:hypothetical protein
MPTLLTEPVATSFPLITTRFARHAVAASLNASAMAAIDTNAASGALNVTGEAMPFAGSVVGLAAALSVAAGAGQLTLDVTVNGTVSGTQVIIGAGVTSGIMSREYGAVRFNAGDTVGVKITTNAGWNGTTADLLACVYLILDNAQF